MVSKKCKQQWKQTYWTQMFTEFNRNQYWAWFISTILMSLIFLIDQLKPCQVLKMKILVSHKDFIKHPLELLTVTHLNLMLWEKLKNSMDMWLIKVVLDNQDHLLSRVLNVFLDWQEKFLNLMIHKSLLMFKDHGYTQKIQLLSLLKLVNLINLWNKIMNYRFPLEMVKELDLSSVINQHTIDTREVKLQLSRTNLSLENEKY